MLLVVCAFVQGHLFVLYVIICFPNQYARSLYLVHIQNLLRIGSLIGCENELNRDTDTIIYETLSII